MRPWPRKETGEEKVIIFNLSGHGHFDMAAYDAYLSGELSNHAMAEDELAASLAALPEIA